MMRFPKTKIKQDGVTFSFSNVNIVLKGSSVKTCSTDYGHSLLFAVATIDGKATSVFEKKMESAISSLKGHFGDLEFDFKIFDFLKLRKFILNGEEVQLNVGEEIPAEISEALANKNLTVTGKVFAWYNADDEKAGISFTVSSIEETK